MAVILFQARCAAIGSIFTHYCRPLLKCKRWRKIFYIRQPSCVYNILSIHIFIRNISVPAMKRSFVSTAMIYHPFITGSIVNNTIMPGRIPVLIRLQYYMFSRYRLKDTQGIKGPKNTYCIRFFCPCIISGYPKKVSLPCSVI